MKIVFFLPLLFLFFAACSDSNTAEVAEVEEPDTCACNALILDELYNHKYLKDRNKPFTGICIDKYLNGNYKMERHYKDGKVHGLFREWHINGTQKNEATFEMNLQHGTSTVWDEHGNVIYKADYTRGKTDTIYVLVPGAF